jgi:N-sulfoglucosamine sulfohydrolase
MNKLLFCTAFAFAFSLSCAHAAKNVLLILCDDLGPHLSVLGTPGIQTPNIDKLAQGGMLFERAYSPAASCAPSRASILTGMAPHSHGIWRNVTSPELNLPDKEFTRESSRFDKLVGLHEDITTLPEILKANGYFTAITQKTHLSPPWKFPFEARISAGSAPGQYKAAMQRFFKQAGDRPFFIEANIGPPHRPFRSYLKANPEQRLPDADKMHIPAYLPDVPAVREEMREYMADVEIVDRIAGTVLSELAKARPNEETLVIFSSDQGYGFQRAKASPYSAGLRIPMIFQGPGVVADKRNATLVSLIDLMPTILDFLGLKIPATVQGKSLWPLLSGKSQELPGREYLFAEHNSHGPVPKEFYPSRVVTDGRFYLIENLDPAKSYLLPDDLRLKPIWENESYQATLDSREQFPLPYRLLQELEHDRGALEFYDNQTDPDQILNLVSRPEQQAKIKEMKQALDTWRQTTGDIQKSVGEFQWRHEPLDNP